MFSTFLMILPLIFQTPTDISSLNEWMPPSEQKQMGINKLDNNEKKALIRWLKITFEKKLKDIGTAHLAIEIISADIVNLSDGSVWEVHSEDRERVVFWNNGEKIKILSSKDATYPYLFVLATNGDTAKTKLLSKPLPNDTGTALNGKDANELRNHWIEQIGKYGQTINLGDGTLWNIAPYHRSVAAEWLIGDNIKIYHTKDSTYTHALMNANTNQTIHVSPSP